jgi:hypothetical protein
VTDAVAQAVAGLSPATRRSARRAALLVAGFTPDLMATLHGPGASTLGALHELVGSGLVVAEGAHAARRLRFLDPVREDLRRGTTSEDLIAAQAALTAHLAAVRPHVAEPPSIPRLAAALGELANVEGMIDLLVEHGRHRERLALVTAASHTWQAEGHWVSGGQHIEDALVAAPDADPFDRARARCVQAFVGSTFDSARRLVPALLEAATVARDAGDLRLEAVLQMHLANGVGYAGQMDDAAAHLARLHELAHVTASEYLELGALMVESTMLLVLGDAAEARQELIDVARALEAFGAPSNAAQIYRLASAGARKLGLVDAALVDLERAEELAGEGLARGTLAMIRADIADLRFQQDPASSLPALTVALEAALGIGNLRAAGILRTRIGGVTSDAIVTAQGTLDLWPVDPRWAAASLARLLDRLPPAHPIQRLAPPVIARLAGSWGAPLDAREAEVVARHAQPGPSEVGDEPVLDALWALATAVGTAQQTA